MAAYMVLQITVSNRDQFREYSQVVVPLMAEFGGKQIVRGATVELLEGKHDGGVLAMFEFPSIEAINAFWTSPKYEPVKALRDGAAEMNIWAVQGI